MHVPTWVHDPERAYNNYKKEQQCVAELSGKIDVLQERIDNLTIELTKSRQEVLRLNKLVETLTPKKKKAVRPRETPTSSLEHSDRSTRRGRDLTYPFEGGEYDDRWLEGRE